MLKREEIKIEGDDFWVKVLGFLQQNWALIEVGEKVTVWFIHDGSGVIDRLEFDSLEKAELGLYRNGFKKYLDPNEKFTEFMAPPQRPFYAFPMNVYSSGEYWQPHPSDRKPGDFGIKRKKNNPD